MNHGILYGCEDTNDVDTLVFVEAFVLCIDKGFPKFRVNLLILYGSAVFIEVFSYHDTIGTVNLRCLTADGILDLAVAWGLAKKPKEIDIYRPQIQDEGDNE